MKFLAGARDIVGAREETLEIHESATITDILVLLVTKHGDKMREYLFDPATGNPWSHLRFLLNGQSISMMKGLGTNPANDSVLMIFPPTAGG